MSLDLSYLGIIESKAVYRNLPASRLTELALANGEGKLSNTGALVVNTGKYTGRSPDDRFVVDEPSIHDEIAWGKINVPISIEKFNNIYNRMCAYLQNRELYVFDGFAGAEKKYQIGVRVVNELASQNMFIHQLLVRPTEDELASFAADFTIVAAPGFKCIPELDGVHSEAAIIVSFERKMVIVAGSQYAGEIKKSVFSVMNYLLP
ncbi:MAG: phosphoenolpyruvate carboxykinase (ATP), partial [Clostridia bacterium]